MSGFAFSDEQAVIGLTPRFASIDQEVGALSAAVAYACLSATLFSGDATLRLSNP
ncbi:MAG: hypothetical protein ACREEE_03945 [Dongiaceae bacterium]